MTSVAYGIAMPASRGFLTPQRYSAQAEAFFARLATQPTQARKQLYDALIRALVAASVWTKLDALYVLAATDQLTALTNLVQAAYGASAVGSPTFTADLGYTGGTNKQLNVAFNPTTAGGHWTANSAALFAWQYSDAGAGLIHAAMACPVGAANSYIYGRFSDNNYYLKANEPTSYISGASPGAAGFWTISRTASNLVTGYRNGASTGTPQTEAPTLPNGNVALLRGWAASDWNVGTLSVAGFGAGLSAADVTALYNAVHAWMQAVAGVA